MYRFSPEGYLILGLILMVAAFNGYFSVLSDIAESPGVLRPISSMVSEPILIFLVSGFLIGLILLVTGVLYIRFRGRFSQQAN